MIRSGRYDLERRLGQGAAATVWLARDTLLERPVAVKILSEALVADREWLARFKREARVAAGLQHPNLVSIYDFDADGEQPCLVMAYLPGGSLRDRLAHGGAPDPERLAGDLLRALAYIHDAGIVHRDIKPGNVMLDADGAACLTDFGIARPEEATAITRTGEIPGTVRYMAPELWRGAPADARSDLYSCGVLLSECLRPETPQHVRALVARLRAEDPEQRPRSAREALHLLDPAPEPVTAVTRIARRQPAPRHLAAAALCLVALGVGALVATAFVGDEEPQREARQTTAQRTTATSKPATTAAPATTPAAAPTTTAAAAAADGAALNAQGHRLIQQGQPAAAIPVLQRAVAALEGSGSIDYAFALFNLGHALRLAGRPAEAIPILERRLQIPNQTKVVKAELKQARKDLKRGAQGPED